jgi:hypothetical protein
MVTSDDVLKFRNQLEDEGRAPLTVNLMIERVLKRAFRVATEEGLIGRNPCATVRPIRLMEDFHLLSSRATMFFMHTAERVIATLRAHETELRQAGLRSLSLFGSVARDETETDSDIDLAAEFDPAARMDLLRLTALERPR